MCLKISCLLYNLLKIFPALISWVYVACGEKKTAAGEGGAGQKRKSLSLDNFLGKGGYGFGRVGGWSYLQSLPAILMNWREGDGYPAAFVLTNI